MYVQIVTQKKRQFPHLKVLLWILVPALALYALSTLMLIPVGATRGHKLNILLLGVDERKGDKGRSDTMIVMSIDYLDKKVRLLSFPRDTRVQIPGKGFDKANAAYTYGGPDCAKQVVSRALDIPIHNYVVANFGAVVRIVDRLGGVTINVDKHMRYDDPYQNLHINIKPGTQVMDGQTALQYARYRSDPEGDISRTRRQQALITAILKKAAMPASWASLPGVLSDIRATIKTDISLARLPFLGLAMIMGAARGVESCTLPGKPAMLHGVSYWVTDQRQVRDTVEHFLLIPPK